MISLEPKIWASLWDSSQHGMWVKSNWKLQSSIRHELDFSVPVGPIGEQIWIDLNALPKK